MKRYTREFVNDNIKRANEWYTGNRDELKKAIIAAEKYLTLCERGLLTDWECIDIVHGLLWESH